jgi:sortase A
MVDQKIIDKMTIEELERALLIKRRQLRQQRLHQLAAEGRLAESSPLLADTDAEAENNVRIQAPVARRFNASRIRRLEANTEPPPDSGPSRHRRKPRKLRDTLLLLVEVAAVFGLIAIGFNSYGTLRTLNQEVAMARAAPEEIAVPTPTPVISFDRLPGGHSPPSANSPAVPEVPAHLQKWVQPAPAQPVPTPSASQATRVTIPTIGVDAPVVEGVEWEDLKKGIGHLPGSANPGERGNVYLAAHNDIFGEIFRDLEHMELGDEFFVYSGAQSFRYVVTSKRIIEPTDISVMYPSTKPIATLQTCHPYLVDTHRLVVIGELAE